MLLVGQTVVGFNFGKRELEKLLQAIEDDQCVVNCIEPHHYDPVIAGRSIDNDVNIWTPTATEPTSVVNIEVVIFSGQLCLVEFSVNISLNFLNAILAC